MSKEALHSAYVTAIDDGYKHIAVAEKTGIPVNSLRQFYAEEVLGPEYSALLEDWLRKRGFMDGTWESRDPFGGIVSSLRSLATDIEAEISFDAKRLRLRSFIDLLRSHPIVIGFEDSKEAGHK